MANPKKSPADRKRKPIFTEVSEETVPNSTPNQILKPKEDRKTPLSYLLQENAPTITTRLGQVQTGVTIIFPCKYNSTKHLLLLFYKNILKICKKTRNTPDFIYTMEECTRNPSIH